MVEGKPAKKGGARVSADTLIEVIAQTRYVSRAARKLKGFLDTNPVAISGKRCLDIGASTGGFTQILLEKGAASVTALDVGKSQLDDSLRGDKRVVSIESTDVREFRTKEPFEVVTCDVSFISLRKILKDIDALASGVVILLFKPQFEVGREAARDSRGVLKWEEEIKEAMKLFEDECAKLGWRLMVKEASTLQGKEGNREWFYCYIKG
ncbi:MAG: TlyA family RNA methyltransferase [Hydrogenimonas sp.]|nr:TlyA family RNA methyltransferase [Hydrogenimonas sp.]